MIDLLEIPTFLDRRSEVPSKIRKTNSKMKWALPKLPKPKGKFKGAKLLCLYFGNEVPRIPTGEREVYMVEKQKWVYLQEKTHSQKTARMTKATFNMVVANTEKRRGM